LDSTSQSTLF